MVPLLLMLTTARGSTYYAFIAPVRGDVPSAPAARCVDTDKLAAADGWLKNNIDPLIKPRWPTAFSLLCSMNRWTWIL